MARPHTTRAHVRRTVAVALLLACAWLIPPCAATEPAVDKSGCAKGAAGNYFGYELHKNKRLQASESASVTFPRLVDSPSLGGITKGVATAATTVKACAEQCDKDFAPTNVAARNCLSFSFRPPPGPGKPGCILGVTGTLRDPTDVISESKVQDYDHYVRNASCHGPRHSDAKKATTATPTATAATAASPTAVPPTPVTTTTTTTSTTARAPSPSAGASVRRVSAFKYKACLAQKCTDL